MLCNTKSTRKQKLILIFLLHDYLKKYEQK